MDAGDLMSIGAGAVSNIATQIVTAIPGWAMHRLPGSITTLTVAIRVRRGVRTGDERRDAAADVYALPGDLTPQVRNR